jgi:FkbM family methyltransferase
MAADLPLRLRVQFAIARRLTAALRAFGLREPMIVLRQDLSRARRLAFERLGSPRYSRPALHRMDVALDRIIDRDGGVFVEAGGFDGFTQSNTYYLERFRGWRGILVEPMPELAALARRNRPAARVIRGALVDGAFDAPTIFMEFGDLMTTVSRPGAEQWAAAGLVQGWRDPRIEAVPARTLSSIIEEAGDPPIDLLSLDVEGHEAAALAGLDLGRHAPAWILVEMHDLGAGRAAIAPALGDRYVEHGALSPVDVLYRRADVSVSGQAAAPETPEAMRAAPG